MEKVKVSIIKEEGCNIVELDKCNPLKVVVRPLKRDAQSS